MDKKKIIKYAAITYAIAWALQIAGSLYMLNNPDMTGQYVFKGSLAVCMFAPLLATLIVNKNLRGMGWKPQIKKNFKWLIFAAYAMAPVTLIGGALFYIIFPSLFDTSGSYLIAQNAESGVDLEKMIRESGLTMQTYMIIQLVPSLIIAPFLNIITAIGEEIGWRGFLYPELNKSLSRAKTWIIGGVFWAVFHFPAMLLGGYEYGFDYIGSPWFGLMVFTLFCITAGIIEEIVYDKTKSIWYAALLHGSINAFLTIPPVFLNANEQAMIDRYAVFGPFGTGLITGLPMLILAIIMGIAVLRKDKEVKV